MTRRIQQRLDGGPHLRACGRAAVAVALAVVCLGMSPVPATAQYLFGQNKVIYGSKTWRVISTPHLDVHYYEGSEDLAEYIADYAERVCEEYDVWFDHTFETRIPFVIYASHHDFKQTNVIDLMLSEYVGGFTDLIRGRVVVPHTGSWTQLREVTRHELVHAYMNDKLGRRMLERRRYNWSPPPLWFTEGLAEYIATPVPGTEARMFMRDFMVNDRLIDIPDLWRINGSFLMYKEGESLVRYMANRFGDEALRALLDGWWKADRFDLALRNTLGMTVEELNRDWKRYLKRRYWPSVMQSDWPSMHGEPLTRRDGINTRPVVIERDDPDAWEFAFLSSASGNIDLMRARRDGDSRFRFETVVASGRNGRFESMPAFASGPDALGDIIAFTAKSGGQDALFVWDMARGRELARYRFDSLVGIYSPTWAPDGRQIAFVGLDRRGWSDLYRVSIDTGNLVRLTEDPAHDRDPDWSPDGTRLVWSSDRDAPRRNGIYHVQLLDLQTGAVTRLTQGEADDASPSWSPSGDRLLLTSDRSGANNIHLYEFDTATLTQLTSTLGGLFTPRWVGNGREFLATSFSNLSFNIYRFDLERIERLPDRKPPLVQVAAMGTPLPTRRVQRPTHWLQDSQGDRFPKNDYDVKFGIDFVRGAVGFDPDFTNGAAAQLGFTDVLGNHRISFLFANSAQSFDDFFRHLTIGATYTNMSHRLHYTLGAFHLTRAYDPNLDVFRYERRTGVLAGLTLPLSRFRRIEQTVVARTSQLEDFDAALMGVKPNSVLLSTYTSFVHDNTLWAWYGPVKGTRFNITVGRTFDPSNAGRGSRSAHLDYRHYRQLPGRSVFASRLSGHGNWGGEFQNFFLGGPFDLRGFDRRALFSRTVVLLNQELRFPLLDRLLIGLPVAPLEFGGFRGALFNDVAWIGRPFPGWYGAYGVGVELNLGFGFITRWNTGNTHDFHTTLDRFSRFFLGWNF